MKRLIINADDFGFTSDVNAGIIHAHREGVLTSTTLMANGDAFDDAVRLAHETPSLDIGCHLVLVQGQSLLTGEPYPRDPIRLLAALTRGGLDVYAELHSQIAKIVAAGISPTHLDSHKHTHIVPHVFRAVVRLAQKFGIPYVRLPFDWTAPFSRIPCQILDPAYRRIASRYGAKLTDHFLGYRLTGSLDAVSFRAALARLREGTTEFMCHPGFLGPELQDATTRLKESRVRELEALTDPGIREFMAAESIRLVTFCRGN